MSGGRPVPLVLLHGFTGAPASWARVRRHLDPARPVLAPALPGHDGTAGGELLTDFALEVDRLAERVRTWIADDAASRQAPTLAGYSLGGRVALGLVIRHPVLFRSAVLIGSHPGLSEHAERETRREQDEAWARLLETEGLSTFVAAWERLPLFATQVRLSAGTVAEQRRIRGAHDPRGLARALRVLGLGVMPDYRPQLAAIQRPVRLVVGESDEKFRGLAAEMARRIPGSEVRVVPESGHNVVLERPEDVARILEESDS